MRPRPYVLSPAYLAYARGVRELHRLEVGGLSESPEADEVRDGMDRPWRGLGEAEAERAAGLSEDLYSITDPLREPEPMNPAAQSGLNDFYEARERGDWDRALALLRRWERHVSPPLLAYLRGTVWRQAGDEEAAALFFERAHRLEPGDARFLVEFLRSSDPVGVRPELDRLLAHPESLPIGLLIYAIGEAIQAEPRPSSADDRRFAAILGEALDRPAERDSSLDAALRPFGHGLRGLCLETIGDSRAAMDSYTRGLAIDPDNAVLLAARGLLGYGVHPGAIDDLERAASLGADEFWTLLVLAHHRLREGRYPECLRLCDAALRLDGPASARSELAEWIALARAEAEFPAAMVREAFEQAVRANPSNERARRNRELYEARLGASDQSEPRRFDLRTPREVRASVPAGGRFTLAA